MDTHLALALDQAVRNSLDLYEQLHCRLQATDNELKKSYRKLARKLHPDKLGAAADTQRFHEIVQAYEVLSNPTARDLYDEAASSWLTAERYVNEYSDLSLTVSGLMLQDGSTRRRRRPAPLASPSHLLTAA